MKQFFVFPTDYNEMECPASIGKALRQAPSMHTDGCWFDLEEGSPQFRALEWLVENRKYPILTNESPCEGRWYPATGANMTSKFFQGIEYCLLSPDVYKALDFPKPAGWSLSCPYPWFKYGEAVAAAITVIGKRIEEGKWP